MAADRGPAYDHCAALLRDVDRDRYFADLFAPAPLRPHLFALHAFSAEVARVRDAISAPMAGEIRLQWWRDAITGEARGDVGGHPVASALLDTVERFRLPRQALLDLIDARTFDLYDDPHPTLRDLEGYLGETSSALIRLGALILAERGDPGFAEAAGHAGLAYGFAGLLRALPFHAHQGQVFLPADVLARHGVSRDEIVRGATGPGLAAAARDIVATARDREAKARDALRDLPRSLRAAFLPLALAPADLATASRRPDPLQPFPERSPLRTLWLLWRASRTGF